MNDNILKLASVDYVDSKSSGGELKAKAWLCTRNGLSETMYDYGCLEQYIGTILESVNYTDSFSQDSQSVFSHQIAKVVFKEEKSMAEVNQWLNFEAKIDMGENPMCSNLSAMAALGFCAVCPWPDNVPWPEAN